MNNRIRWAEILLIFLIFFLDGAYLAPDVNEAHYLGKAARFWNPNYAPGDFLLSTPDAHGVFVWTFGWITCLVPLSAAAWAGRLACWGAMAYFWRRLSWAILPINWLSILTAGVFVSLLTNCHLAGEWVFGGMEAKSIAFVFVFWGLEQMVRGKWSRVWIILGIASMFHVLVGGWTVFAALSTYVVLLITRQIPFALKDVITLPAGGLISLPGLIPALMLNQGASKQIVQTAEQLYVYERLPHHLILTGFPFWYKVRFAILSLTALLFIIWTLRQKSDAFLPLKRLAIYVCAALCVAGGGVILSELSLSYPEKMAGLLRFYWFRLSDIAVPLGVTFMSCAALGAINEHAFIKAQDNVGKSKFARFIWIIAGLILLGIAGGQIGFNLNRLAFPVPPRQCAMAKINYTAWLDVCKWAKENTPSDAVFIVPKMTRTFTWHSERGTVVTWKDVPQDAAGLIEWQSRIERLYVRPNPHKKGAYLWNDSLVLQSPERIKQSAKRYSARYLLTNARTPINLPRVYQNRYYTVYEIQ